MKIPMATAAQSITVSAVPQRREDAAITPMIDIGCILKCGAGLLGCLYCLTNPVCWLSCAGPVAFNCIKDCIL